MFVQAALSVAHGLPELFVDDTQFRNLLDDPVLFLIKLGNAFAGLRVFDLAQAVPDESADVKLIVDDTSFALPIAIDGAWTPGFAGWSCNSFLIQLNGNCLGRLADGIVAADADNDGSFLVIDGPAALLFPRYNVHNRSTCRRPTCLVQPALLGLYESCRQGL